MSMNDLGVTLISLAQYAEAETLLLQAHEIQSRVLGPNNRNTAFSTYNLACIAARRNQRDEALSLLQEAVDHGLSPNQALHMEKDDNLKFLHGDPRFDTLVAHAKERAAPAAKK